jgi:hypothetical protein
LKPVGVFRSQPVRIEASGKSVSAELVEIASARIDLWAIAQWKTAPWKIDLS